MKKNIIFTATKIKLVSHMIPVVWSIESNGTVVASSDFYQGNGWKTVRIPFAPDHSHYVEVLDAAVETTGLPRPEEEIIYQDERFLDETGYISIDPYELLLSNVSLPAKYRIAPDGTVCVYVSIMNNHVPDQLRFKISPVHPCYKEVVPFAKAPALTV